MLSIFERFIIVIELEHQEDFSTLDWVCISGLKNLSREFIVKYWHLLNWRILCTKQNFTQEFLEKYIHLVDLIAVHTFQKKNVSSEFLEKNPVKSFSKKNLRASLNKNVCPNVSFEYIFRYIERYHKEEFFHIDWKQLSTYRRLSEDFISKYMKFLDMNTISNTQRLSEFFIRNYSDVLNISSVSIANSSSLSLDFFIENKGKINIKTLKKMNHLKNKNQLSNIWYYDNIVQKRLSNRILDDNFIRSSYLFLDEKHSSDDMYLKLKTY